MEPMLVETDDDGHDAVDAELDALDVGGGAQPVDEPAEDDEFGDEQSTEIEDEFQTGESLFVGDEPTKSETSSSDSEADDGGDDGEDPFDFDATAEGSDLSALAAAVNEGAARAAVTGLDPDEHDKDGLETEFAETFAAFKLGHFAGKVADEYVFTDDKDEVDPIWGLVATMMLCSAFAIWSRPDSEQQIERIKDAINGIGGGDN